MIGGGLLEVPKTLVRTLSVDSDEEVCKVDEEEGTTRGGIADESRVLTRIHTSGRR